MTALPTREASDADVLVLGASFFGVELVRELVRRRGREPLRVCVVDRLSRQPYVPLCHELLTGRLSSEEATLETAAYVTSHGGEYVQDEIVGLDPATHTVTLASGRTLVGRTVVVALGSNVMSPPVHPSSATAGTVHLRGLKASEDVDAVARALASIRGRPARVAVVGGGISGCELAGELGVLRRERPELSVVLVHRGERLLEGLRPVVSRMALGRLRMQGVDVRLRASLDVDDEGACRVAGTAEAFDVVVWSMGVEAPPIARRLGLATDPRGWIRVGRALECDAALGIFAGGDIIQMIGPSGPVPAMRRAIEASAIAKNVLALLRAETAGRSHALVPYQPLRDFPHGVSLGARSLLVLGPFCFDLFSFTVWFRRFLMRGYFRRYAPRR
jgi:NADH dehydrogenase FAD-containing subunit